MINLTATGSQAAKESSLSLSSPSSSSSSSSEDPFALTYDDPKKSLPFQVVDLRCLDSKSWVNDEILSAFFQDLEQEHAVKWLGPFSLQQKPRQSFLKKNKIVCALLPFFLCLCILFFLSFFLFSFFLSFFFSFPLPSSFFLFFFFHFRTKNPQPRILGHCMSTTTTSFWVWLTAAKQEAYELDPFAGETSSLRSSCSASFHSPRDLHCANFGLPPFLLSFHLTFFSRNSELQYFPKQTNSYDCGVICCVLAAGIASDRPLVPLLQGSSENLRTFVKGTISDGCLRWSALAEDLSLLNVSIEE